MGADPPQRNLARAPLTEGAQVPGPHAQGPLHVLFLDGPDWDAGPVLAALAGPQPAQVERVKSLQEAIARLAAGGVDVALLDLKDGHRRTEHRDVVTVPPDTAVAALAGLAEGSPEQSAQQMRPPTAAATADQDVLSRILAQAAQSQRLQLVLRRKRHAAVEAAHPFRSLLDSIHDGLVETDAAGNILYANPGFVRMLGYDSLEQLHEEVPGMGALYAHPEERAQAVERVQRTPGAVLEAEMRKRDGSTVWVEATATPVAQPDGSVHFQGLLRDVTSRRMEHDLRDRLAAIIATTTDAVYSKDTRGVITTWNEAAERLYGFKADDIIGWPATLLAVPGEESLMTDAFATVLAGLKVGPVEVQRRRKDGTIVDVELSVSPLRDPHGSVVGGSVIARDITARKRMQEALAAAHAQLQDRANLVAVTNRELERFADALAHDLQTPLSSMTNLAAMVEDEVGADPSPELRTHLASLRSSSAQAMGLLCSVLDYARAGRASADRVPTDLASLAREAAVPLQPALEQAGARLEVDALPTLKVDPDGLRRLFRNLFENSLKYRSAEPPMVRVTGTKDKGFWSVCVTDNGIGIPPDKLETVFEPFNRERTQFTQTSYALGLALCRRIVQNHDGTIWAESEGQGTRIRFCLPADTGDENGGST